MINFAVKKVKDSPFYELNFFKEVHKRTGEIVEEPKDTIHSLNLDDVKNLISHAETRTNFGNEDVSLQTYMKAFQKNYVKVCELLKKTL